MFEVTLKIGSQEAIVNDLRISGTSFVQYSSSCYSLRTILLEINDCKRALLVKASGNVSH